MTALQQMAQFLKENGHTELAQKAKELLDVERSQIREAYEQGCHDTVNEYRVDEYGSNKDWCGSASAQYYQDTFMQ